jgi:hypothetical protein
MNDIYLGASPPRIVREARKPVSASVPMLAAGGTLGLSITQADIDAGMRHSPLLCPLARALAALAPGAQAWAARVVCRLCWPDGYRMVFSYPDDLKIFISAFDSGLPVSPATFTLTVKEAGHEAARLA